MKDFEQYNFFQEIPRDNKKRNSEHNTADKLRKFVPFQKIRVYPQIKNIKFYNFDCLERITEQLITERTRFNPETNGNIKQVNNPAADMIIDFIFLHAEIKVMQKRYLV